MATRVTRGRRVTSPISASLDNIGKMYIIKKENEYNQKIKDAIVNPELFILPGINKNNKNHIYIWRKSGSYLNIIDPYNNREWSIEWSYETTNNWEHDNFDLAKTISDQYKWVDVSIRWKIKRIEPRFKSLRNKNWITIQDLFDKYPGWIVSNPSKTRRWTKVPSSKWQRKFI